MVLAEGHPRAADIAFGLAMRAYGFEAHKTAEKTAPGPVTVMASTPEAVARGKLVFEKAACVSCHGANGLGDGPQSKDAKFLNENGTKAVPRDLTAGLFKGGDSPHHIYSRVFLGIPGTPMPMSGLTVSQSDLIDLVHFVKSLDR